MSETWTELNQFEAFKPMNEKMQETGQLLRYSAHESLLAGVCRCETDSCANDVSCVVFFGVVFTLSLR